MPSFLRGGRSQQMLRDEWLQASVAPTVGVCRGPGDEGEGGGEVEEEDLPESGFTLSGLLKTGWNEV